MKYHERPELSFHQLMDFAKNPEYFYKKHVEKHPDWRRPPSASMEFGTAIHLAVLQPDEFARTVRLIPDEFLTPGGSLSTKKEAKEWVANRDKEIVWVSKCDYEHIKFLAERARNSFSEYLNNAEFEKVILSEVEGIAVRAQIDIIADKHVHDVKTIGNLDDALDNMKKYNYIEQLAWYAMLTKKSVGSLLFVETSLPYRTGIYAVTAADVIPALNKLSETFNAYKNAIESDDFKPKPLSLNQ